MNVAIFASAFHPYVGGVEEHCRQVAHELIRQGHAPIVLTNRWPRTMPHFDLFEGIPVHRIAFRQPESGTKSYVSYYLTHRKICQEVLSILKTFAADVLHVHCISGNAHYARLAHRALGIPLIVTTHGEVTMDATGVFQRSRFANRELRRSLRAADAITACSRKTLAEVEEHVGHKLSDRSSVVYNGIRPEDFAVKAPFEHPRPYVLAIGRLVPQKGFDVLIRAMALLPASGPDLLIAGEGPEDGSLRQLVDELSLADRVHFVGRADRSMAVSLFHGCAFFVLPSRKEPMGIVNLEAMIAGKAVIASRVGGVPEIVLEDRTGLFVQPDDPNALAEAMAMLLADDELRDRLGAAGRIRAQGFTWEQMTGRYLELYEKVMSPLAQSV